MSGIWRRFVDLRRSRRFGLLGLAVANAVPLVGVLVLGWDVWTILIVYWLENGVIGAFTVARLMTVRPRGGAPSATLRATQIPFFVVHYGIFWVVHGVFVFTLPLFVGGDGGATPVAPMSLEGTVLAVIALAVAHGITFWVDWWRGGARHAANFQAQMMAPYPRLIVLHVTIVLGASLVAMLGQPVVLVALLVVLKTGLDVGLYLRSGRRPAAAG